MAAIPGSPGLSDTDPYEKRARASGPSPFRRLRLRTSSEAPF